jgi:hypothetical protein
MTNQNPAVPQPDSPKLDREILAKVNAHADRSMDRLFADIEELLSGDLEADAPATNVNYINQQSEYPNASRYTQQSEQPIYPPQSDFTAPPQSLDPPLASTSDRPKKSIPLWLKALLGLGAATIAIGGGLTWLINERKIELPKSVDTSWLPFQSRPSVSPADAKFADYMRQSIAKIEAGRIQSAIAPAPVNSTPINANPTTPTNSFITATPGSQTTLITPNTGVVTTATNIKPQQAVQLSISLLKTTQTGNRPSAVFEINNRPQTVGVGQKIGTSDWSLLTVAKGEVILKRKGGEIRSIYIGQKF